MMAIRRKQNKKPSGPAWVIALIVAVSLASHVLANTVRLHEQAGSSGPTVTLEEVADLDGDDASRFGGVIVGAFGENAPTLQVSMETVREALTRQGANWGTLSLVGFNRCQVTRLQEPAVVDADRPEVDHATVAVNLEHEIDLKTPLTLRDHLRETIASRCGADPADLRITFREADGARLDMSLMRNRFEVGFATKNVLGRIPIRIHTLSRGRTDGSFMITARVERRVLGVVATRVIPSRRPFPSDAVEVRELWLDTEDGPPLTDLSMVVGQMAAVAIRPGMAISAHMIRPPLLVRRGDPVTVRVVIGDLSVRSVAKAVEDGALDDVITLRRQGGRDTFTATVTGLREATILMDPIAPRPAAPASARRSPDGLSRTIATFREQSK